MISLKNISQSLLKFGSTDKYCYLFDISHVDFHTLFLEYFFYKGFSKHPKKVKTDTATYVWLSTIEWKGNFVFPWLL